MSDNHHDSGFNAFLAFLLGGVVGAGIALLVAPQSGKETRKKIVDLAETAKDKVLDISEEIIDKAHDLTEKVKDMGEEKLEELADAVKRVQTGIQKALETKKSHR